MKFFRNLLDRFDLQLFAGEGAGDGGDGGDGGVDTGVTGHIPDDQRLLELGVPKNKLPKRKNVAYQKAESQKSDVANQTEESKPDEGQSHAAENPAEGTEPHRMTWDEIKNDPEYKAAYDKETSSLIRSRLRSAKIAEENMATLMPALEVLARNMGMDMEHIDYGKLAEAINGDRSYYEDMALEKGDSVEKVMKEDQENRAARRGEIAQQKSAEDAAIEAHVDALYEQGQQLKKLFPSFDLHTELKNPAFRRMTAPGEGLMSVEDAYRAVHRKELEAAAAQVTAQMTAQQLSNAIQSGSRRPQEHGTSGQAPTVTTFDYSKMGKEDRAKYDAWVRSELRAGRKPRPGDYPG